MEAKVGFFGGKKYIGQTVQSDPYFHKILRNRKLEKWGVKVDLYQIVFVNLSAFVLAGSHLVLSNTKAESI